MGQICQIISDPPNIEVVVNGPVPHCLTKSASVRKGHWQIRLVGNVTTFKRAAKALASLVDCQKIPMKLLPLLVHPSAFFGEKCCIHPSDVHTKTEPKLSSTLLAPRVVAILYPARLRWIHTHKGILVCLITVNYKLLKQPYLINLHLFMAHRELEKHLWLVM